MELQQDQEMNLEMHIEQMRRQLNEVQETQELLVNYLQQVAIAMGIQAKVKHLDARLEEIRSGHLDDDAHHQQEDTKP